MVPVKSTNVHYPIASGNISSKASTSFPLSKSHPTAELQILGRTPDMIQSGKCSV